MRTHTGGGYGNGEIWLGETEHVQIQLWWA